MKKHISKIIAVIVIIILILTSFMLGAYASGNTLKNIVLGKASSDIGRVGSQKKDSLIANIDILIEERILLQKSELIEQKGLEVEDALDEYFDGKVAELMQTEEFEDLDDDIEFIKEDVVGRYKVEIDAAFKGK